MRQQEARRRVSSLVVQTETCDGSHHVVDVAVLVLKERHAARRNSLSLRQQEPREHRVQSAGSGGSGGTLRSFTPPKSSLKPVATPLPIARHSLTQCASESLLSNKSPANRHHKQQMVSKL
jgi:hypothetical protein